MTTEKKEVFDGLKCGNCGYDGGEAHLIEKMSWQEENHKLRLEAQAAKAVSNDTKQTRAITLGIVTVLCCIVMSITYGVTRPTIPHPVTPINPVVSAQENLKDMYNTCVQQARYNETDRQSVASGIAACNATFGNQINQMRIVSPITAISSDSEKK